MISFSYQVIFRFHANFQGFKICPISEVKRFRFALVLWSPGNCGALLACDEVAVQVWTVCTRFSICLSICPVQRDGKGCLFNLNVYGAFMTQVFHKSSYPVSSK